MTFKFKELQSYAIVCTAYFFVAALITLTMVLVYSPWFILLVVIFFVGFHAKYSTHTVCPKCGHEYDYDVEADKDFSST